jgi:hypothetical protein
VKLPCSYALAALVAAAILASPAAAAKKPRAAVRDSAALSPIAAMVQADGGAPGAAAAVREPWTRATLVLAGATGKVSFEPPHVSGAPEIDGSLDEALWTQAAVLDSFTHSRPVEGVRDSLGTIAMVMYDDQNLYIAFHASDSRTEVQAPIVPRDQIWQGDWVGVSIDTYNDQQRSFFLCANPLGIQMDGVDMEGRDSDMAPDFQYSSKGRLTENGYDVEFAIPFRTLRFIPGEKVTFGFQAIRDVRRNGTHMYWAPVSRNINSYHSQIGKLTDLQGVRPGRNLQVNPTHTTTTLGQRGVSKLAWAQPEGQFGLGLKYGITSNLIADVTFTPDFSQVEADAGVVDINERFAIFFEEKRPFFLEGSDIFTSPTNLVYTRRIADPMYGAKLTGKVGRTTIGILNAADRSAGNGIDGLPNEVNPYVDHDAQYSIVRLKHDVFKSSYVGFLVGDRSHEDQYNRGLGVDGRMRWADKYSFTFQGAHSWAKDQDFRGALSQLTPTQLADAPGELSGLVGDRRQGDNYLLELSRDSRPLNVGINTFGYSPQFAADMGFIQRTDFRAVSGWFRPHIWGKEKQWYTGIHFPVYVERDFSWDGKTPIEDVISVVQEINFPKNSWAGMENVRRFIRHNGVDFHNIYRRAIWAGSERYRTIRGGALYVWGDQVVFAETAPGHDRRWEIWSDFRFGSQFDGGLLLRGSTVWRDANDAKFAEAFIPRLRVSYQFSKELSLRVITELVSRKFYDANEVLTERSQVLAPDVLMSYYVRPGTVVYLGYGSLLQGQDRDDLTPQRASVFTKVSYLWQL